MSRKKQTSAPPQADLEEDLDRIEDADVELLVEPVATSRRVLEQTPGRVLNFLRGLGNRRSIQIAMASRGYTRADHVEGWRKLEAAGGFDPEDIDEPFATGVAEAITKLDEWASDNYPIIVASLRARYPAQLEYLTPGQELERGPDAVLSVKRLCERLDGLTDDPEREATREEDKAALELLARRGIGEEARHRLRVLIEAAQALRDVDPDEIAREEAAEEAQLRALQDLRLWFEEWSAIARVAVTQRGDLIRLGLARRRARVAEPDPAPEPAPDPAPNPEPVPNPPA